MLPFKLERPLAFFDIEATGISPRSDRIVELAVIKLLPNGKREAHTWRINPGCPIPPETIAIHGISDEDVADCPTFDQVADEIYRVFEDCDLAGYNHDRFDIPMLTEEFDRAGVFFDMDERRSIDVQRIFHRREPRDLTAALAFYCDEMHLDAHGAQADVEATIRVLEGQFERYTDLPADLDSLEEYCNPRDPSWVDRAGRLRWIDGEVALNFGKKKGTTLKAMVDDDPGFLKWMLRSDFPRDTQQIVRDAMNGTYPDPPE
jgi:DNA polymerase-3 subunit epsilon